MNINLFTDWGKVGGFETLLHVADVQGDVLKYFPKEQWELSVWGSTLTFIMSLCFCWTVS